MGPGDHVVVANPVSPDVLSAIVASGARYVDAGRDHRFAIDPGGWRTVLADPRTKLAYLPAKNYPTATTPDPARYSECAAAGVPVLGDDRFVGRRFRWVRVPGVPSREAASTLDGAVGASEWTWRDAVVIEG